MTAPEVPVPRLTWVIGGAALGLATVGFFLGIDPLGGAEDPASNPLVRAPETGGEIAPAPQRGSLGPFVPSEHGPNAGRQSDLSQLRSLAPPLDPALAADPAARAASLAQRAQRRAFNGAPPTIPHAIAERDARSCLACHATGLAIGDRIAPRIPHEHYSQCTQCHVENVGQTEAFVVSLFEGLPAPDGGERAGPGAPPQIPHSTLQREDCLACHGSLGAPGMRTTHPERTQCLQCHAVNAILDQVLTRTSPPLGASQ